VQIISLLHKTYTADDDFDTAVAELMTGVRLAAASLQEADTVIDYFTSKILPKLRTNYQVS